MGEASVVAYPGGGRTTGCVLVWVEHIKGLSVKGSGKEVMKSQRKTRHLSTQLQLLLLPGRSAEKQTGRGMNQI